MSTSEGERSTGNVPTELKEQPKKKELSQKKTSSKKGTSKNTIAADQPNTKEHAKAILRSLGELESLMRTISKNVDRQSKEIGNLQVQIAALQKDAKAMDRTMVETVKFIHNRGWKKKKHN